MTTPTVPLHLSDELVGVAWIASLDAIAGIGGQQAVATRLPPDALKSGKPAPWTATGFITVSVVGGSPHTYLPVSNPVLQVDCYAVKPGSTRPPWWQADALASVIRYACWDRTAGARRPLPVVVNGVTYPSASVSSARLLTAFRRMYSDAAGYAHYSADLQMSWSTVNDHPD